MLRLLPIFHEADCAQDDQRGGHEFLGGARAGARAAVNRVTAAARRLWQRKDRRGGRRAPRKAAGDSRTRFRSGQSVPAPSSPCRMRRRAERAGANAEVSASVVDPDGIRQRVIVRGWRTFHRPDGEDRRPVHRYRRPSTSMPMASSSATRPGSSPNCRHRG